MHLTKAQSKIFLSNKRFKVVVAGRRFGKTFLSTASLLQAAVSGKNKNCWYVAPTYGMAKEIAWDMLLDVIPYEYISKSNETALRLDLINGSTIALKGAEKPHNLRGRALDFCVLDEYADMRPEAFYEVIRPSLSDRNGSALFIGTPKGRNHLYDIYTKGLDDDYYQSFQFTTLDGGNVDAAEIEAAENDLDQRTFEQEYLAQFVNYAGIIYYGFSREQSVQTTEEADGVLHIGLDFNLDPMSAVVAVRKGSRLFVVDEIMIYSSNTDEMCDEIKARYPHRNIIIYPDPAARQRKTSAAGRTDLSILQNAGFTVYCKNSHALVRDRINAVNSRLRSKNGERNLFIDKKCKQTIKALERQTYKEGTHQPDKEGGYDHANDALGYLVDYLFPVRREYSAPIKQRWT